MAPSSILSAAPWRIQFHEAMPGDPDWMHRTEALQSKKAENGLLAGRKKKDCEEFDEERKLFCPFWGRTDFKLFQVSKHDSAVGDTTKQDAL